MLRLATTTSPVGVMMGMLSQMIPCSTSTTWPEENTKEEKEEQHSLCLLVSSTCPPTPQQHASVWSKAPWEYSRSSQKPTHSPVSGAVLWEGEGQSHFSFPEPKAWSPVLPCSAPSWRHLNGSSDTAGSLPQHLGPCCSLELSLPAHLDK